jgi:hypothetical protein
LKGLADNPVHTIATDGLIALVSVLETPAAGTAFDEALKDPEQTKSLILDHHRVLQCLLESRTVLPMRFGVLFTNSSKVSASLHAHRDDLLKALEKVDGAREWGVKMFCDRSVLSGHLRESSPAMLAAQDELAAAAQGRAFFLQRRIARLGEEDVQRTVVQGVDASHLRLCAVANAHASMKLQSAAVHRRADDMVWNGAYLVAKVNERRFFALIEELGRIYASQGFQYEANGPWPPFSFAEYGLGE